MQKRKHNRKHKQNHFFCLFFALIFIFSSVYLCQNETFAAETSVPVVYTFDIGIPPKEYQTLISDESEPVFSVVFSVDGGASFPGEIRLRGNSSKMYGLAIPTKRIPVQFKFKKTIPLKETINNSCIKLINSLTPYRLLAEYIALDLFSFCGIPTPAHEFIFLRYNDVDFGLYLAVENVNKDFLAKNFSSPFGSLLKESEGNGNLLVPYSSWFGGLRMVQDNGTERVLALMDALDRGKGYEEYLDIEEVLRFFACTAACGAEDSILSEKSNYFLYDTGEKFVLLPWDLSEAFSASETGNGIDSFQSRLGGSSPSALFDLLMREEQNRAKYHAYLQEINDRFLAPEIMEPYLQELAALVAPFLSRDPTMLCNLPFETPVVPEEGYGSVGSLLYTLTKIHGNLAEQLNGSVHVFYANPANDEILSLEEADRRFEYLLQHSPTIDPDITDRICENYPAYCRKAGSPQSGAGDPLGTVIVLAVSFVVFFAAFLLVRRSVNKKRTKQRAIPPGTGGGDA